MTLAALSLRSRAADSAHIEVRTVGGPDGDRRVIWVQLGDDPSAGQATSPMSAQASANLAHAATVARDEGTPLVVVLSSTGADISEGIASLEGWGRVAKALVDCSGVVPTILVVDGPAVSGPALLLGIADLVVMTADSYAFVNGPVMVAEFTGRADLHRRAGWCCPPRSAHRRRQPRRRRPGGGGGGGDRAARVSPVER